MESADNINDQIKIIEKYILTFSKIYNKLANTDLLNFIFKDKEVQDMMLSDIYNTHSEVEQLLREIMEYGINAETLRQYKEYQQQHPHNNSGAGSNHHHHHNNKGPEDDNDDGEEGYTFQEDDD